MHGMHLLGVGHTPSKIRNNENEFGNTFDLNATLVLQATCTIICNTHYDLATYTN